MVRKYSVDKAISQFYIKLQAAQAQAENEDHVGHGENTRVCMGIFTIGFKK